MIVFVVVGFGLVAWFGLLFLALVLVSINQRVPRPLKAPKNVRRVPCENAKSA